MVSRNLEFESASQMSAIFGPYDANMKELEKLLKVSAVCRDMVLTVTGEERAAEKAVSAIETLKKMYDNGQQINPLVIGQALELAEDGSAEDVITVMKDVLTITFKGKPVKVQDNRTEKLYEGDYGQYSDYLYRSCRYRKDLSCHRDGC